MSLPTTPEGILAAAQRIENFLNDDVIADVMQRLERKFYEEFIGADTSELRVRAWAKATVLREWEREMRAIISNGEKELLVKNKKDQRANLVQM